MQISKHFCADLVGAFLCVPG